MSTRKSSRDQQDQITVLRNELTALRGDVRALRESILGLRYHTCVTRAGVPATPGLASMREAMPLDAQFEQLQQTVPRAFPIWRSLLDANTQTYEGFPIHSCSVAGHPAATLFKYFLAPYLKGRVLDIGCGPQPVPLYLEDHPLEAVYGIDPITEPDDHPFTFVKSMAEFLPWLDSQFDAVVAATSLDHVLLLDETLAEIRRVLKHNGRFVVWVGFIEGAKPYDPYDSKIAKVDDWHLFHFGREWFQEAVAPYFLLEETFALDEAGSSCFVAFRPRK